MISVRPGAKSPSAPVSLYARARSITPKQARLIVLSGGVWKKTSVSINEKGDIGCSPIGERGGGGLAIDMIDPVTGFHSRESCPLSCSLWPPRADRRSMVSDEHFDGFAKPTL